MPRVTRSTATARISPQPETSQDTTLQNATNTRARRRGRAPGGALAAKLKAKAKAASPLPPSSPSPSGSSKWPENDTIPVATSEDPPFVDEHEQSTHGRDFDQDASGSDDSHLNDELSTASDPFGFLRVEKVLKQARATSEIPIYSTPEADAEILSTPSTPRRRRSSSIPPVARALPSTPSPIKPSTSRQRFDNSDQTIHSSQDSLEAEDVESDIHSDEIPTPKTKGKARATAKAARDPAKMEKKWESVLPKRTLRTRKRVNHDDSDSEEEETEKPKKKTKRKVTAKARKDKLREEDDEDLDEVCIHNFFLSDR